MKAILAGVGLLISGVILYGMRLISAAILAQYAGFHDLNTGLAMIGSWSKYSSFILIILGIVLIVVGFFQEEKP